jgi:hypothetical protein
MDSGSTKGRHFTAHKGPSWVPLAFRVT